MKSWIYFWELTLYLILILRIYDTSVLSERKGLIYTLLGRMIFMWKAFHHAGTRRFFTTLSRKAAPDWTKELAYPWRAKLGRYFKIQTKIDTVSYWGLSCIFLRMGISLWILCIMFRAGLPCWRTKRIDCDACFMTNNAATTTGISATLNRISIFSCGAIGIILLFTKRIWLWQHFW